MDHGAQVSLVRKELLSVIKEGNQWSTSQYEARNLRMDGQPIGAGGEALDAVAVVVLDVAVERLRRHNSFHALPWNSPSQFGRANSKTVHLFWGLMHWETGIQYR